MTEEELKRQDALNKMTFEQSMQKLIVEDKEMELELRKRELARVEKADVLHLRLLEQRLANEEQRAVLMVRQHEEYTSTQQQVRSYYASMEKNKIPPAVH